MRYCVATRQETQTGCKGNILSRKEAEAVDIYFRCMARDSAIMKIILQMTMVWIFHFYTMWYGCIWFHKMNAIKVKDQSNFQFCYNLSTNELGCIQTLIVMPLLLTHSCALVTKSDDEISMDIFLRYASIAWRILHSGGVGSWDQ